MAPGLLIPAGDDLAPMLSDSGLAEVRGSAREIHAIPQLGVQLHTSGFDQPRQRRFNARATILLAFFSPRSSRRKEVFGNAILTAMPHQIPSGTDLLARTTTLMQGEGHFLVEILPQDFLAADVYSVHCDDFFDALLWATVLPTYAATRCNLHVERLDDSTAVRIVSWWAPLGGLGTPSAVNA